MIAHCIKQLSYKDFRRFVTFVLKLWNSMNKWFGIYQGTLWRRYIYNRFVMSRICRRKRRFHVLQMWFWRQNMILKESYRFSNIFTWMWRLKTEEKALIRYSIFERPPELQCTGKYVCLSFVFQAELLDFWNNKSSSRTWRTFTNDLLIFSVSRPRSVKL